MRTKPILKFCGNQSAADYVKSISHGAEWIGFIFFAESPRYVLPDDVQTWVASHGKKNEQKLVGVFVQPDIEKIASTLRSFPSMDIIQLHGRETPDMCRLVKSRFQRDVIKVIHHNENGLEQMRAFAGIVDGFLIDTKTKLWGGSGQTFDWSSVPAYMEEANRQGVTCFIAGGVNPANIAKLLEYEPHGIDVASGIEVEGQKSIEQMKRMEAVLYGTRNDLS
ncbi:phosphoribosylanthranilate isomerase [Bacillaceae bacterium SIJ1]|uniref:phosphoribosylanthranilate isomerase n=1 Tax=Litoribacterium kuwaitense TaxID=1398745 RepID=UPI0013EB8374|nr:phosphoribosylanthranilate isomerase [Litoribacterium kuwaitense]NGP43713.1 phosphoribosylanthranilate isomerase [Litoribacterium kuwaitense]